MLWLCPSAGEIPTASLIRVDMENKVPFIKTYLSLDSNVHFVMTQADLQTAFCCKHFLHTCESTSLHLLHLPCWIRLEEDCSPTITSAAVGNHIETQLA